jgi:hypothetical protein
MIFHREVSQQGARMNSARYGRNRSGRGDCQEARFPGREGRPRLKSDLLP